MKKTSKWIVSSILCILYIGVGSTMLLFFFIPSLLHGTLHAYFQDFLPSALFLYIGGGLAIWMMIEFIRIMQSVRKGSPFLPGNVRCLWRIAVCAGLCSLDFAWILLFVRSIAFAICGMVFLFGCLSAAVLANVFQEAVFFKEENDLTI